MKLPSVEDIPALEGGRIGLDERKSLSDDTTLWAEDVSPEARALFNCLRKVEIVSAGLEPVLESVEVLSLSFSVDEDFGAWASRLVSTLWAVEVSPEFKAFWMESRAFDKGSEGWAFVLAQGPPTPIGPRFLGREFLSAARALWADEVSPDARSLLDSASMRS